MQYVFSHAPVVRTFNNLYYRSSIHSQNLKDDNCYDIVVYVKRGRISSALFFKYNEVPGQVLQLPEHQVLHGEIFKHDILLLRRIGVSFIVKRRLKIASADK